jgi:alkylation response protein AidB-like acyl-CoA dehydrogenase
MSEISVERHPAIRSILDGVKPVRKLTTEAEAIAAAREAADEIRKLAKDASLNDQVPVRQADILSEYGLTSIYVPGEFGGLGASIQTIVEVVRIISAADGGVGQILQIHNVMIRGVFNRTDDDFRARLIEDILAGKRFGNALAEGKGKGKGGLTRVERNAQGKLVLNGRKVFATGCLLAEWISVSASSDEGPVGVLLHRNTPGVILEDDWDAFGQQHSVSGSVRFVNLVLEDYQVNQRSPQLNTSDEKTAAAPAVRTNLTWPQILHAAIDTGIARGALEAATDYLRNHSHVWVDADVERAAQEQMIIKQIGDYAIAVRTAESLLRDAAELFDEYRNTKDSDHLQDELILAVATARAKSDQASIFIGSDIFSLLGASSAYNKFNLNRVFGDSRVHTTHDPIRWRLHHIGNYYLNGIPPDEYSAASARKRAASLIPDQLGEVI